MRWPRRRGFFLCSLILLSCVQSGLQAAYQIQVSSQAIVTPKSTKKRKPNPHPIRAARKSIEGAIRKTSPNPRVQSPGTQALPTQAPEMRVLTPTPEPEASGADRFLNGAAKIMTRSWRGNIFVWLPAISTDPNTGPTYGLMPVLVLADSLTHHIRHLLAPSYTYNELFGQTGTMRYYWYPTDASQLYATGSVSERVNREVKVRYENSSAHDGVLYLRGEVYHNVDASQRFFGIGPYTREKDETGYTAKSSVARAAAGINFFHYWRASIGARFMRFATQENIIPNTVYLADRFPNINGIGTNNTISNEFRLLWDTRDSPITPSRGSSGELFTEKTSVALGSNADYIRYGLEGKRFFLWKNPKQVTVVHALYEWCNGPNIPFYLLPQLGGRTTLRGYGEGRLVDRGRLVMNVEQRMIFSSLALMGIQTNFELAPFFDLGTVFPTVPEIQGKNFRPVYGAAFRAAVKPNVVGDVEVGIGKEGPAVFVDINYPF